MKRLIISQDMIQQDFVYLTPEKAMTAYQKIKDRIEARFKDGENTITFDLESGETSILVHKIASVTISDYHEEALDRAAFELAKRRKALQREILGDDKPAIAAT